jgi:8-hydroxy-5-deazaflavin:NADPH oxidoreductase
MNIGIIGSGQVGKTLGAGFASRGHRVMIGSREPGREDLVEWRESTGENASTGSDFEAAEFGELIVFATRWSGAEEAVGLAGHENFSGKIVIDTTNPIGDDGAGNLVLSTTPNLSAAEHLQRWLPEARIVKAFNWVGAANMVDPHFEGGPASGFLCSDDAEAKETVAGFLRDFGWDPVDMGELVAARGLEPLVIVWMSYGWVHGTWDHALKVVRKH